jgi:diaminopimelate epimerase
MPSSVARPQPIAFIKMQGTGNDFVLIDARSQSMDDYSALSEAICDRHRGVGADGLLVLDNPDGLRMRMWNPDGSLSEMCGNGLRCFARFALDQGIASGRFSVITGAGNLSAMEAPNQEISVNLGKVSVGILRTPLVDHLEGTEVSVGNPHVVVFVPQLDLVDVRWLGPQIENLPRYPNRTNVHFAQVLSPTEVKILHWERGAGTTLACGTGMVATVAAGFATGRLEDKVEVTVPGGKTRVALEGQNAWLTGAAAYVFRGIWDDRSSSV